ncbi:MAG TPA: hypothetical protein VKD90_09975 [Gemmataceae bacterium]|nr:hypothetical protein [Gemmataceae bacterium]
MTAVDTNVFIYALDADEPVKQAKAQQLLDQLSLASGSTVLPWQVAGEILNNLRRSEAAGDLPAGDVEPQLRTFLAMFPLVIPNAAAFARYSNFAPASVYRTGTRCCSPPATKPASPRCIPRTWTPGRTTTA